MNDYDIYSAKMANNIIENILEQDKQKDIIKIENKRLKGI